MTLNLKSDGSGTVRVLARISIYAKKNSTDRDIQGLITRYEPYCEVVKREFESLHIYADKPQFIQLLEEIEEKRLGFHYHLIEEYSKQELDSAEYLVIDPAIEIADSIGDDFGLFYDPSCSLCRAFIHQHSDLRVKAKYAGKKEFVSASEREHLVSPQFKEILESAGLEGAGYRPVYSSKGELDLVSARSPEHSSASASFKRL